MIKINTDTMQELAAAMNSAAQRIEEAKQILDQTVEHDKWTCQERNTINENTKQAQRSAQALMEYSQALARAVQQMADKFSEREQAIAVMFSSVDTVIGKTLGQLSNGSVSDYDAHMYEIVQQIGGTPMEGIDAYVAGSLDGGIPMCNFEDIRIGTEE